ncbi:hypothetical protein NP493_240g01001 [Ridgeia piscesae]|uniref:Uncharacterized protein n=1 Tax=Ridgeia piscesae TaxID=27915 RepID=A0AAD9NZJ3_RIDPI|nr:hypothetical protein NP493_240g01001 [Ridgeia piscesae]
MGRVALRSSGPNERTARVLLFPSIFSSPSGGWLTENKSFPNMCDINQRRTFFNRMSGSRTRQRVSCHRNEAVRILSPERGMLAACGRHLCLHVHKSGT